MNKLMKFVKSKSNWPSIILFVVLSIAYVIGLFSERFSYIAIGGMFMLIVIEGFIKQIILIEDIKDQIKHLTPQLSPNCVELKKRDKIRSIREVLQEAKHELFVSGINMHGWSSFINILKSRTDLKIRILVLDTNDTDLCRAYEAMRGRPMFCKAEPFLKHLTECTHIEMREISAITPAMFVAYDMDKPYGYIKVEYFSNANSGEIFLNIELTSDNNKEWYQRYKEQIEHLWDRAKPWTSESISK